MQYVVGMLIMLTIGVLVWHHFGMERVMEFSAASGRAVEVVDDRIQGGTSVGKLTRRKDALVMDCDLTKTFQWPYCRILFTLSRNEHGVNFSDFDSISFDLTYTSPGAPLARLFMRNFEPGLSKLEDHMSQKINEAQFEVPATGTVRIPTKVLRTAQWWTDLVRAPLLHTDMRIDNVTTVDLSFGTNTAIGHHHVELRSLKFHGKWITQNDLLLIIVCVWVAVALVWLGFGLLHYRSQFGRSSNELAMLSQVNQALQLETLELADQAYRDPLTGALNREGLRDALMTRWQKNGVQDVMAVVFVDLDHFKSVNDTHGHDVGDAVLKAFAAAVQGEIRCSDKFARWGGEEFLIICPGTGAAEAHALADKLRQTVDQLAWPHGLQITASFGITTLNKGEEIGDAIKRADVALYRAKSNGRNCVEMA